jgi:hypothetical protein
MSLSASLQYAPLAARYQQFTTATTVVVFAGAGVFYGCYGITAGTTWAITVYDNVAASGNQLAAFTNAANTFFGPAGSTVLLPGGIVFGTGLTITATGTPGILNVLYQVN